MTQITLDTVIKVDTRADGEIAFLDGVVDGADVRIRTKKGEAFQYRLSGTTITANSPEAAGAVLAKIEERKAALAAFAARRAAMIEQAPAKLEELMAHVRAWPDDGEERREEMLGIFERYAAAHIASIASGGHPHEAWTDMEELAARVMRDSLYKNECQRRGL